MQFIFCRQSFGILFLCGAAQVQCSVCKYFVVRAVCGQNPCDAGAVQQKCARDISTEQSIFLRHNNKNGSTVWYVSTVSSIFAKTYGTLVR